tara:strand:- start:356 stop:655 length:300 start_codon:yes stop_codon:yes gene_type:complete
MERTKGEKLILSINREGSVYVQSIPTDFHGQIYTASFTQKKMYGKSRIKAFKEATKVARAREDTILKTCTRSEAVELISKEVEAKTGYAPAWNTYYMPD